MAHIVIDKRDGKMVHLLTLIILVLYISQYIENYIRVVRISVGNITILEAEIVATLSCMCKVVVVSEVITTTPCNRGIATPVICFGISMNNTMVRRV